MLERARIRASTAGRKALLFPEDFSGEGFDGCAVLPGFRWQAGFAAGLFEKCHTVPAMFDRNLRKQQAAAAVLADEQAVAADFYVFGPDGLQVRQDAEGNFQFGSFFGGDGRKACVLECRSPRGFCDGAIERSCGENESDAAVQLSTEINGGEGPRGSAR